MDLLANLSILVYSREWRKTRFVKSGFILSRSNKGCKYSSLGHYAMFGIWRGRVMLVIEINPTRCMEQVCIKIQPCCGDHMASCPYVDHVQPVWELQKMGGRQNGVGPAPVQGALGLITWGLPKGFLAMWWTPAATFLGQNAAQASWPPFSCIIRIVLLNIDCNSEIEVYSDVFNLWSAEWKRGGRKSYLYIFPKN